LAARSATSAIPIVFSVGIDPAAEGPVASLSRPGGNLTSGPSNLGAIGYAETPSEPGMLKAADSLV